MNDHPIEKHLTNRFDMYLADSYPFPNDISRKVQEPKNPIFNPACTIKMSTSRIKSVSNWEAFTLSSLQALQHRLEAVTAQKSHLKFNRRFLHRV